MFLCVHLFWGSCDSKIRFSFRASFNSSCFGSKIYKMWILMHFALIPFIGNPSGLGLLLWILFKSLPLVTHLLFSVHDCLFTHFVTLPTGHLLDLHQKSCSIWFTSVSEIHPHRQKYYFIIEEVQEKNPLSFEHYLCARLWIRHFIYVLILWLDKYVMVTIFSA